MRNAYEVAVTGYQRATCLETTLSVEEAYKYIYTIQ